MIWAMRGGEEAFTRQRQRERVFPAEETEYADEVCFLCGWSLRLEDQAGRGSAGLDHTGLRCQESKLGLGPVGSGSHGRFWTREASSQAAF